MAHKQVNWPAIKKRYLQGQTPKEIAAEYGLAAKQISNKAYEEKWTSKRQEISEKVAISIEDNLKALCDVTVEVHREFMQNLKGQMKDIQNPYLFDGERTNSLFQTAMNNSVKLMMASMSKPEEDDLETPGREEFDPDMATPQELIERIRARGL